jgi:hypothetical protein
MRKYGGGLTKFEPNDLNEALVPSPEWLAAISAGSMANGLEYVARNGRLPTELEQRFHSILS